MPALPLDDAGPYVAAAYVLFVLLLVVYIGIMAAKLGRIRRELDEVAEAVRRKPDGLGDAIAEADPDPGEKQTAAR